MSLFLKYQTCHQTIASWVWWAIDKQLWQASKAEQKEIKSIDENHAGGIGHWKLSAGSNAHKCLK